MEEFKPGQVISPQTTPAPATPAVPDVPPAGAPQPERPSEPTAPPSPASAAEPSVAAVHENTAQDGWQFRNEAQTTLASATPAPADEYVLPSRSDYSEDEELTWTASEFIAHEKSVGWYGMLALVAVVAAAIIYVLTKDKVSTGVVILAAAAFGAFAHRKPQTQQYVLRPDGLQIGQKMYSLQDFKTFSIAEEGAIASIVFMPLKRFMPPLSIYVAPELEDRVVDFLSAYMPFEQHKADAVDSLLRRIRF